MHPVIGIPCRAVYREGSKRPMYGNNRTYIHAVENAGGLPILIPLLKDYQTLEGLISRLDGILFSGGFDLQPSLYGEERHEALGQCDPELDELEIAMANWALQEDMPILGSCRGMQLLNVVLGGSLYQDIASQYPGALEHCPDRDRTEASHLVTIEEGSQMEKIMEVQQVAVNSLHHQAIKQLGAGVRITGRAPDGIAEMLEVPGRRFVVAMQSHPEEMYANTVECERLFRAFVAACADLPALTLEPERVMEQLRG